MWLVREREREEELMKGSAVQENQEENPKEDEFRISFWTRFYYSNIFRALIIILLISLLIPTLIFLFVDMSETQYDDNHTCTSFKNRQIPCGPQNTSYENCKQMKCCFDDADKSCFHFLPSYYIYNRNTSNLFDPSQELTPFGRKNLPVYLNVMKNSNYKVSLIFSTNNLEQSNNENIFPDSDYSVKVSEDNLMVVINRTNNEILLSTSYLPVIISEKYWEVTIDLHAERLFGMDFFEMNQNSTLKRVIYKNARDHSCVAKFMAYNNKKFHGLEVKHEGPLEISVISSNLIVFRVLSGEKLIFELTTGPMPKDVYNQQSVNDLGLNIPYWALGVHICRSGNNKQYIEDVLNLLNEKNILYESDCIHEDIFTLSGNLDSNKNDILNVIQKLKDKNKMFLMTLVPHILYDNSTNSVYNQAQKLNLLYMKDNEIYLGSYLNQVVAFPDYSLKSAQEWFKNNFDIYLADFQPNGFILKNDWAVNDKSNANFGNEFQYLSKDIWRAMLKTIPWDSTSPSGSNHISTHNTYGYDFSEIISNQIQPKFISSSSLNPNNKFSSHIQNVDSTWLSFKTNLIKILSLSLFGETFLSVPVCGDNESFSSELNQALCLRWYLTAATVPMFRLNSNVFKRDPTVYNNLLYVKNLMIEAINIRYTLLPYYYTVYSENLPIIRPLFFNFPHDMQTFNLTTQYMIGSHLLIAQPILFPIPNIRVFLPDVRGGWYEFWGGMKVPTCGWVTVPIVESDLVAFVQAGSITPLQNEPTTAIEELRKPAFKLIIALLCTNNSTSCTAEGSLKMENTIKIDFSASEINFTIFNAHKCNPLKSQTKFEIKKLQVYNEVVKYYNIPAEDTVFCIEKNSKITINY